MTSEIARMVVRAFADSAQISASEGTEHLSAREMEILALVAEGCPNKEIASRLFISSATVRTHLMHIYEKLHVHSRTEAVVKQHDHVALAMDLVVELEVVHLFKWHRVLLRFVLWPFTVGIDPFSHIGITGDEFPQGAFSGVSVLRRSATDVICNPGYLSINHVGRGINLLHGRVQF